MAKNALRLHFYPSNLILDLSMLVIMHLAGAGSSASPKILLAALQAAALDYSHFLVLLKTTSFCVTKVLFAEIASRLTFSLHFFYSHKRNEAKKSAHELMRFLLRKTAAGPYRSSLSFCCAKLHSARSTAIACNSGFLIRLIRPRRMQELI